MTEKELAECERWASELHASIYGDDVPKLCAEIRALWAIRDAVMRLRGNEQAYHATVLADHDRAAKYANESDQATIDALVALDAYERRVRKDGGT